MFKSYEAEFVRKLCEKTGSVTALLYGNPMGPMTFLEKDTNGENLFGSQLLAYSWDLSIKEPEKYVVSKIFTFTNRDFPTFL
jgi:hypothetical protein